MESCNTASENKLVERILTEAREQAALIESKARDDAAEIDDEKKKKRSSAASVTEQKLKNSIRSVIDGAETRASIEGKKYVLSLKRKLLDQVFESAYEHIAAEDPGLMTDLLSSLLEHETSGGEEIVPAAADRDRIASLIASSFSARSLAVSKEDADLDHGFIVRGNGFDKDCSLRSVLNNVRETEETQVAKLLFG